jgi:hypothetical protein
VTEYSIATCTSDRRIDRRRLSPSRPGVAACHLSAHAQQTRTPGRQQQRTEPTRRLAFYCDQRRCSEAMMAARLSELLDSAPARSQPNGRGAGIIQMVLKMSCWVSPSSASHMTRSLTRTAQKRLRTCWRDGWPSTERICESPRRHELGGRTSGIRARQATNRSTRWNLLLEPSEFAEMHHESGPLCHGTMERPKELPGATAMQEPWKTGMPHLKELLLCMRQLDPNLEVFMRSLVCCPSQFFTTAHFV